MRRRTAVCPSSRRTSHSRKLAVLSLSAAMLTGCAQAVEPQGSTATQPRAPQTRTQEAPDEVRTLEITIRGREVSPPPARVELAAGEVLRLVVTADQDMELHAHGLGEVDERLPAGRPTTVDLSSQVSGRYEVETHDPDLRLLLVAVR